MEKMYVKPQVEAKNASCGSYAAGCPTGSRDGSSHRATTSDGRYGFCEDCEIAS